MLELKELKELLENTFAAFDDVWGDKFPYPSKRFGSLLRGFTLTLWRELGSMMPRI